jgi:Methyltransferase domain
VQSFRSPPLQTAAEHDSFIAILVRAKVRSYLEIGAMWGASLWKVANAMPRGSRVVAVDSMVDRPEAEHQLEDCIAELKRRGYDAHFIFGDSTHQSTIERVRQLGPYDALFIDGNHSEKYVRADWTNYGAMARIVGFHDINWKNTWRSARNNTPPPDGSTMGAERVWNTIKDDYPHKEFRLHPDNNYHGIGVLWTGQQ